MNTNKERLTIGSIEIEVVRKEIKNMHLAVYPPEGHVRLAVPEKTDEEVYRLFAISKLAWLKKHIKNFKAQDRESERTFVSGETHYFKGRKYLLELIPHEGFNKLQLSGKNKMLLYTKVDASREEKANILKEWYRKQLKKEIPALLSKWEKIIGVQTDSWGVKIMKTKWGACNVDEKRIWLNLELAKKPVICLEYIIVHELVHLLERSHNERFVRYMDKFMPQWRLHRDALNSLPVAHNDWGY